MRLASALAVSKLVALLCGPTGLALVGQHQNFLAALQALGSGGVTSGVVSSTARSDAPAQRLQCWSAACQIALACSLLTAIVVATAAQYLATQVYRSTAYWGIVTLSAALTAAGGLNLIALAALSGLQAHGRYFAAMFVTAVGTVLVTYASITRSGAEGALFGLTVSQVLSLIASSALLATTKEWQGLELARRARPAVYSNLLSFSLMTAATSIAGPACTILIREKVIQHLGLAMAGYWEATNRLSGMLIVVLTAPLTTYLLPKLAASKNAHQTLRNVMRASVTLVPAAALIAGCCVAGRYELIRYLFSADFTPAAEFAVFQLFGDVPRVFMWIAAHFYMSQSMTKTFVVTELAWVATSYVLSTKFLEWDVHAAPSVAYLITNWTFALIAAGVLWQRLGRPR